MDVVPGNTLLPGDPRLIDHIVCELKSQGIFDQFRKECIADVDTKPAYQNLRQRVEGSVTGFLKTQNWRQDMNKNQLREALRKNIYESGFLETGVERIVDQVVNPKINSVFLPQVEDVVYKFLGLEKPTRNSSYKNINGPLSINTLDLLPTDLDPISPDLEILDKTLNKSDKSNETTNLDDSKLDDFESPPFEPITDQNVYMQIDESSNDSKISGISGLTSHDSNLSEKEVKITAPDVTNPDSQLSKVSSNSRLSIITTDSKHTPEKMDISDDTDGSKSSTSFHFENKIPVAENGFLIQQEIKDELEAIRLEINGDFKPKENEEKVEVKDEIAENLQAMMEIEPKVEPKLEPKEDDQVEIKEEPPIDPPVEEKVPMEVEKPVETPPEPEKPDPNISKEEPDPPKEEINKEKTDEVPQTPDQTKEPKKSESKSDKSDRHRHDSERRKDKDKKSDREKDKKYSSSSKSSSSSSSKDKDKNRDKNKSSSSSSSKPKDDKTESSKSKDDKSNSTSKESTKKDDKSRSSSSKHSSRDRSRTDSKSDSKSDSRSSSSKKDPKKSDDPRSRSEDTRTKPTSSEKTDENKSRKSDSSKSSKSDDKSSSRSREHSRSESSSKHSSRDRKSSSSRDHKDKKDSKDSKDSKDQKKSNKREKDDHSSSREKKDNRRSADRDSNDGSSGIGNNTSVVSKDTSSSNSTKSKTSDSSDSNSGSNSGDSGQSDSQSCQPIPEDQIPLDDQTSETAQTAQTQKSPVKIQSVDAELLLNSLKDGKNDLETTLVKIKKPKFASNIFEARKLMKIRKKLEKIEKKRQRKLELAQNIQNMNSPSIEMDSIEDTDSMDSGKLLIVEADEAETPAESTAKFTNKFHENIVSSLPKVILKRLSNISTKKDDSTKTEEKTKHALGFTSKLTKHRHEFLVNQPKVVLNRLSTVSTKIDENAKSDDPKNNSVVSKESWDAIEARLSQSVNQNVDFDSYIDENNDSSSSTKAEESKTKVKRLSEDEDCLYFNNQVSPTTERFLKSVETFQKTSTLPEKNKMAPPNSERPAKRPRKANLKYNQYIDDSEVIPTNNKKEKETKTTTGAKKKQVKGKKRKIDAETNEIYSENNNKKINNSLNVVDLAEEFDDTMQPSPSASNNSNGSTDTTTRKTNLRGKKNKKNNSVGNNSDSFPFPLSPDSDKMADEKEPIAPVKHTRASASKNQRYSSDDLYKPRPFVSGSSRRQRGMLNSTDKK